MCSSWPNKMYIFFSSKRDTIKLESIGETYHRSRTNRVFEVTKQAATFAYFGSNIDIAIQHYSIEVQNFLHL